ncbi:MAG: hypothetical protein ABEJ56_01885 [Candidatus Nanohaloarchaea archaeon]
MKKALKLCILVFFLTFSVNAKYLDFHEEEGDIEEWHKLYGNSDYAVSNSSRKGTYSLIIDDSGGEGGDEVIGLPVREQSPENISFYTRTGGLENHILKLAKNDDRILRADLDHYIPQDSAWHRVTLSLDWRQNSYRVYMNGSLKGSGSFFDSFSNLNKIIFHVNIGKAWFDSVKTIEETSGVNQSLENTVFVGKGREMLKAITLNSSVLVTENYSRVEEQVKDSGREPISIGIEGPNSIKNINSAFNVSRQRYYTDSRKKAVLLAPIAANQNATLTFDRDKADRDFSNYSYSRLENIFIKKFEPHHVAVGDLESSKGLIASYMAAKRGILPLNWERKTSYPENLTPEKINSDNGVIQLEQKIRKKFRKIGKNRKTVIQGKFISILEGPAKLIEDPVEKGILQGDKKDGDRFRTDLNYGNLDDDHYIEAGVGRYPNKSGKASVLFQRSFDREKGNKALVASEYLHSNWPVILSTAGGGMRHGTSTYRVLKEQGFNTTHYVEYRLDPISFLTGLVPSDLIDFFRASEETSGTLSKYTDISSGIVGNSMIALRSTYFAEQLMEMYYEYRWNTFEIHFQRGIRKLKELEGVTDPDPKTGLRKNVMKLLYAFLMPERHPKLNESNIKDGIESADIVYYRGIGNTSGWTLPNKAPSLIQDRYRGVNRLKPEEVPGTGRAIIWDNSNNAGSGDNPMRKSFLEQNASAYLGFSSVNYAAYTAIMGQNFFRYYERLGNSMKKSVNSLESSSLIYSPAAVFKSGLKKKISRSLRLYGNPEMRKDPIENKMFKKRKNCYEGFCRINITLVPPQKVAELEGSKFLVSNTTDYILEPGAPVIPLYTARFEIPGIDSESIETSTESRNLSNIRLRKHSTLTSGGKLVNYTENYSSFPEVMINYSFTEDLRLAIAGAKKIENKTSVLEEARISIEYTSPATLELFKENKSLKAEIYTSSPLKAKLIWKLGDNTSTKNISLEKGLNSFELEKLPYGINEVEAYLLSDNLKLESRRSFKVKKKPSIIVFAPDIALGSTRKVTAIVENPNNFSAEYGISVDTGNKTVLGIMEDDSRKISIGAADEKMVNWRVTALKQGKSSISVADNIAEIKITSSRDSRLVFSPENFLNYFTSPRTRISISQNGSSLKADWKSRRGSVSIYKTPRIERRMLKTDNFKISSISSASRNHLRIHRNDKHYTIKRNNLDLKNLDQETKEAVRNYRKYLKKETEKLEKIIRLQVPPEN